MLLPCSFYTASIIWSALSLIILTNIHVAYNRQIHLSPCQIFHLKFKSYFPLNMYQMIKSDYRPSSDSSFLLKTDQHRSRDTESSL